LRLVLMIVPDLPARPRWTPCHPLCCG